MAYADRVALRKAIRLCLSGFLCFPGREAAPKLVCAKRGSMRSELVYSAGLRVPNRYLLSTLAMKAVHRLHVTNTRVEETTNQVFSVVANGAYLRVTLPEVKSVRDVDSILISPAL
jgi:hypothetical protein